MAYVMKNTSSIAMIFSMTFIINGCAVYHRSSYMVPECERCNDLFITAHGQSNGTFELQGIIIPIIPTWEFPHRDVFYLTLQNHEMSCPDFLVGQDTIKGKMKSSVQTFPTCEYRHAPPIDSGTIIIDTAQIPIRWKNIKRRWYAPMMTV